MRQLKMILFILLIASSALAAKNPDSCDQNLAGIKSSDAKIAKAKIIADQILNPKSVVEFKFGDGKAYSFQSDYEYGMALLDTISKELAHDRDFLLMKVGNVSFFPDSAMSPEADQIVVVALNIHAIPNKILKSESLPIYAQVMIELAHDHTVMDQFTGEIGQRGGVGGNIRRPVGLRLIFHNELPWGAQVVGIALGTQLKHLQSVVRLLNAKAKAAKSEPLFLGEPTIVNNNDVEIRIRSNVTVDELAAIIAAVG